MISRTPMLYSQVARRAQFFQPGFSDWKQRLRTQRVVFNYEYGYNHDLDNTPQGATFEVLPCSPIFRHEHVVP
jgi:hypothetical protein